MNDFFRNDDGFYFVSIMVGCNFKQFFVVIYFLPLLEHLMYLGQDALNIYMHLHT
jgi:hypothetical protein